MLAPTPDRDDEVARILEHGKTIGVWQIESPGMRSLLTRMNARTLLDVIQSVALIRPGPAGSGMMERFIKRRRGEEPVPELPPGIASFLAPAEGVMLYQEDLIRVLSELCGLGLGEADLLRRAVGGGSYYYSHKHSQQEKHWPNAKAFFEQSTKERGVPRELADSFWKQIERFASFSFNKAHSVTYGRLAWRLARIKVRAPAAVLAAILANDTGYYQKRVYVEEAKRCGVAVLPPCVNRSALEFRAERLGALGRPAMRAGLGEVRELGQRVLRDAAARTRRARALLFGRRPRAPHRRARSHGRGARGRAPDPRRCLRSSRRHAPRKALALSHRVRAATTHRRGRVRSATATGDFALRRCSAAEAARDSVSPDFDDRERARVEQELLGFTTGLHPLDLDPLPEGFVDGCLPLREAPAHVGRDVRVIGWLAAMRRTRTRTGSWMCFLTLEDQDAILEALLFPDVYERFGAELGSQGRYLFRGRIEAREGALALHTTALERIDG